MAPRKMEKVGLGKLAARAQATQASALESESGMEQISTPKSSSEEELVSIGVEEKNDKLQELS
jgi:hypothetical protein